MCIFFSLLGVKQYMGPSVLTQLCCLWKKRGSSNAKNTFCNLEITKLVKKYVVIPTDRIDIIVCNDSV